VLRRGNNRLKKRAIAGRFLFGKAGFLQNQQGGRPSKGGVLIFAAARRSFLARRRYPGPPQPKKKKGGPKLLGSGKGGKTSESEHAGGANVGYKSKTGSEPELFLILNQEERIWERAARGEGNWKFWRR